MPVVTVIVPAYNAGAYLDATLASISKQNFRDFECIVVDDFSDDNTFEIAKNWRAKDRRIRVVMQRARAGVSAARNTGLRASNSPLVCFLDADDLMMHDSLVLRLRAYQQALRADPEGAGRVAGSYCASQSIPEEAKSPPPSRPMVLSPLGFATTGGACPFNANQPLIRTDVLYECGGFNEAMDQAEDYDLWARILRAGYWFMPAPHVAVTYRNRRGSAVRKAPVRHLTNSLALYDSALQSLDADALGRSPYRLIRPFGDYAHQAGKAGRILQFSGMSMAAPDAPPLAEIAARITAQLPDLGHVVAPAKPVRRQVEEGIRRQLSGPVPEEMEPQLDQLLQMLAEAPPPASVYESTDATAFGPYGEADQDRLWHPARQAEADILFLPHKDYHAWTIGLFAPALQRLGISFAVVDLAATWREGGVRQVAEDLGLPLIRYGEVALGRYAPRLVVAFNDWDYVTRPILVAAQEAGIATAAIVEGIQDYLDKDTGRPRHAYRTAQTVLLPGAFDRRYFPQDGAQHLEVVGIPRIEHLRSQPRPSRPPAGPGAKVLINSNFSHNVLVEKRDLWLRQVVEAVQAAGMVPVISRHPEDRGTLFPEFVTDQDFYTAIQDCSLSVQRFASGILEALAINVPVIYFNPHGEEVDKFSSDPMGAYPVALTPEALSAALADLPNWQQAALAAAPAFLDHHAGAPKGDTATSTAEALVRAMGAKPDDAVLDRFSHNLRVLDFETQSLTRRVNLFEDPATAIAQLREMTARPEFQPVSSESMRLWSLQTVKEPNAQPTVRRSGLVWRIRMRLHNRLERAYMATARWPRLQARLRGMAEYYRRRFWPL
ncbi:glycosyltransferase [Xinfangfangia sp. D13-10-4-6]|uniref:glycosyltransferase family 2 protein n=1 Tax=Pseudogemmobacter hezensis TaxID=2737662 RepID=UPI001551E15A|nr:glycosyltransferase [Pseudogemmobacter hezensis]NPD15319.1 glycosyltransferase [Pseudogemmobacter hezensis]